MTIIKGFKFNESFINILCQRFNQGLYRYKKSKNGKASFKIRLYCIVIYYLFKSLKFKEDISLNICRDFIGREDDIKKTLIYFLNNNLNINFGDRIYFQKLNHDSNAHKYSYLMRHDTKNLMKNFYISISLKEIEKWLIK